jgi:hypothetical protein
MNKLFIFFLSLNLYSCKCTFSEKIEFVKWEKNRNIFIKTNLYLGNLEYSLNIESCIKKKGNLKLTTTVFSRNQKKSKFYIIGYNTMTRNHDTLSIFTNFKNEFSINVKKYNSFVFKEEENEIATKYLIQEFLQR